MKITKKIDGNTTTYFFDGVKKYEHYKDSNGGERWSDDHPDNPKNNKIEVSLGEFTPFVFEGKE